MLNTKRKGLLLDINKSALRRHKKSIYALQGYAVEYGVPLNILIGIFMLEISSRGRLFRFAEYSATIAGILVNILFGVPVKNYTIGKCQVGLTSILIYHGFSDYNIHSRNVDNFNLKKLFLVVKSMRFKTNSRIFAEKISKYYKTISNSSLAHNSIIFIGEYYNGKFSYGLSLEKAVHELNTIFA